MGLATMELNGVVLEIFIVETNHTLIGLCRNLCHLMTTIGKTLQIGHRLSVVQYKGTFQFVAFLHAWHIESWMTAYLEMDLLGVGILHMPSHNNLVAIKTIADGEIEMIGIDLQGLFTVMKGIRHAVFGLSHQRKLGITGKSMTWQMILLAINGIGIVVDAANNRKQYG